MNNYSSFINGHDIMKSLHQRRMYFRLCFLYKIIYNHVDIDFSKYFEWDCKKTLRRRNSLQISPVFARVNSFKYSFVSRTVNEWNTLPDTVVRSETLHVFKTRLNDYLLSCHELSCDICDNL